MRRTIAALVVAAAVALAGAGCSDDEADDTTTGTTADATAAGDAVDQDLRAEATDATVAYFTARATGDADAAREVASAAAETVIDWNEAVGSIDAVAGTPYAVPATASPDVRTEIGELVEEDGRWLADGFIELSTRPAGAIPASTTAPPTTEGEAPEPPPTNAYVTDLVFERDGDALVLVDYRFDDVPYPVSELYLAAGSASADVEPTAGDDDSTTSTTSGDSQGDGADPGTSTPAGDGGAAVRFGHRAMDGSVRWVLAHEAGQRLDRALLRPDTDPAGGTPPAEGIDLEVFDDGDDGSALVVWPGGFPGAAGTIELTQAEVDGDGATGADDAAPAGPVATVLVEVPPFPDLGSPRPLEAVREGEEEQEGSTTTSTTGPEPSSTTSVPQDEPVDLPPPTVPDGAPTTTVPSTTSRPTTSSSSTTTTSTSTTLGG